MTEMTIEIVKHHDRAPHLNQDRPCKKCGKRDPDVEFGNTIHYRRSDGTKSCYRDSYCKGCRSAYMDRYHRIRNIRAGKKPARKRKADSSRPCNVCGKRPPEVKFYFKRGGKYRLSRCNSCSNKANSIRKKKIRKARKERKE